MKRNADKLGRDSAIMGLVVAVVLLVTTFVDLTAEQATAITGVLSAIAMLGFRFGRDATQGPPR